MKNLFKGLLLFALMGMFNFSYSQVGINAPNPDNNAVLDLKSPASGPKGLLIPRMSSSDRKSLNIGGKISANGLLVFDTTNHEFYFYHRAQNQWFTLSPWDSKGESTSDVILGTAGNVGVGTSTPQTKMSISGNSVIGAKSFVDTAKAPDNGLAVQGNVGIGTNYPSEKLEVNGNVKANKFEGYGTTPIGGIIMWSGSTNQIPDGWAICDGNNNTPDLSGRFIIGAGTRKRIWLKSDGSTVEDNNTTYSPGNKGGFDLIHLKSSESALPSHNHVMSHGHSINDPGHSHTLPLHDEGGGGYVDDSGNDYYSTTNTGSSTTGITIYNFTGNTQDTGKGATDAHENRPPYYTLAFIMRIK